MENKNFQTDEPLDLDTKRAEEPVQVIIFEAVLEVEKPVKDSNFDQNQGSKIEIGLDILNNLNSKTGGDSVSVLELEQKVKGQRKCWERFLGMALMTLASMLGSLSVAMVKYFEHYQVYSVSMWRFCGGCFLPAIPILLYIQFIQKSEPFQTIYPLNQRDKFKMMCTLLVRGFTGCASIILLYNALKYLSISDSTVISFSTPVFVTFLACLFLGEKFGVMNILAALVTLIGVTIITRPPFLTGEREMDTNAMMGVGLSLGSMLFATFVFLTLRILKDVNYCVVILYFGLIGTVVSFILSQVFGSFELPRSSWDWFLVFLLSLLTFSSQALATIAFKYEDAGPLSLCRSFDVIFSFIWQALFFSITPDEYSIIGSMIVLSGVILIGFRKHLSSLPTEHPCRRICGLILR